MGVALVALTGELDLTNAAELAERLDELAGQAASLILDLNRVVFIDSAALNCLFRIARERGRTGLALVCRPGAPVFATLAMVEFGRAATIATTVDEATSVLTPASSV